MMNTIQQLSVGPSPWVLYTLKHALRSHKFVHHPGLMDEAKSILHIADYFYSIQNFEIFRMKSLYYHDTLSLCISSTFKVFFI